MANQLKRYSRQAPRDRSLRASNADRDAVADILRSQHSEGRLDTDEFGERFGRCLEAKTYAELDQLIADLPDEGVVQAEPLSVAPAWVPQPQRWVSARWRFPVLTWLAVAAAVFVLSGYRFLWIFIPLGFFAVRPLLWRSSVRSPSRASGPWDRRGGWGAWCCGSGYRGPIV
ncbi:MAG TPA: DUF1707 domain-containing protein [Acidimicrobiales bacterium]|nr:DUF1707 domain-containing protein [Acidimicrobiales bacterium]